MLAIEVCVASSGFLPQKINGDLATEQRL
jgi:hypothetical protein